MKIHITSVDIKKSMKSVFILRCLYCNYSHFRRWSATDGAFRIVRTCSTFRNIFRVSVDGPKSGGKDGEMGMLNGSNPSPHFPPFLSSDIR